jgi:hypothetical protein
MDSALDTDHDTEQCTTQWLKSLSHNYRSLSGGLDGKSTSFTDVVSVVEMRDYPSVVIEREPMSLTLCNKLVDPSEKKDSRSRGIYFKSLKCAFNILESSHLECALFLFFLSDERPSDAFKHGRALLTPSQFHNL